MWEGLQARQLPHQASVSLPHSPQPTRALPSAHLSACNLTEDASHPEETTPGPLAIRKLGLTFCLLQVGTHSRMAIDLEASDLEAPASAALGGGLGPGLDESRWRQRCRRLRLGHPAGQ